jgi:hypothetical protein
MPERSKAMNQTKREALVLQVGFGRRIENPTLEKALSVEEILMITARWKHLNADENQRIRTNGGQSYKRL